MTQDEIRPVHRSAPGTLPQPGTVGMVDEPAHEIFPLDDDDTSPIPRRWGLAGQSPAFFWSALRSNARRSALMIGRHVFDGLFPQICLVCRAPVDCQGTVCAACWPDFAFIDEPLCQITGMPFIHGFGEGMVSAAAIADPPPYRRARAALVHDGAARRMVTRLKYADRTDLAPWMARWMLRAAARSIAECDLMTAVPLHRTRYCSRRYNQSAELGRAMAGLCPLPFMPAILARTRPTRRQVGLSAQDRQVNVRAAFAVPDEQAIQVAGRRILLIDDVLTTGATVKAATRALLKAKASAVDVVTFSMVVPGHMPGR